MESKAAGVSARALSWAVAIAFPVVAIWATMDARVQALAACQEPDASTGIDSWTVTFMAIPVVVVAVVISLIARRFIPYAVPLLLFLIVPIYLISLTYASWALSSAPAPGCTPGDDIWWPFWRIGG